MEREKKKTKKTKTLYKNILVIHAISVHSNFPYEKQIFSKILNCSLAIF